MEKMEWILAAQNQLAIGVQQLEKNKLGIQKLEENQQAPNVH